MQNKSNRQYIRAQKKMKHTRLQSAIPYVRDDGTLGAKFVWSDHRAARRFDRRTPAAQTAHRTLTRPRTRAARRRGCATRSSAASGDGNSDPDPDPERHHLTLLSPCNQRLSARLTPVLGVAA